jgi:hypothetical protein
MPAQRGEVDGRHLQPAAFASWSVRNAHREGPS